MSLVAGAVHIKLDADTLGLSKNVRQAGSDISALDASSAIASKGFLGLGNIGDYVFGNLIGNAIGKAASSIKGFIDSQIDSGKSFESTRMAFDGLLGSAEVAGNTMKEIVKLAADTPFEIPELAESGKMLAAFGIEAKDIVPSIRMVGDVAAGLNVPIKDMAYLVGTIKSQGKAMTADLNQFANRGVPIWKALEKITGKNNEQLRDMAEKGKISFDLINQAFKGMTAEGGQFSGMMARQASTLGGLQSTLSDAFGGIGRRIIGINDMGEVLEGGLFDKMRKGTAQMIEFATSPAVVGFAEKIGGSIVLFGGLMNEVTSSLINIGKVLYSGDFKGGIFGLEEDSLVVGSLLTIRETALGTYDILFKGDYTNPIWGQLEDSAIVDYLFSVREAFILIRDSAIFLITGQLKNSFEGLDESSPFIAFLTGVRDVSIFYSQNVLPFMLTKLNEFSNWFHNVASPAISGFVLTVWNGALLPALNSFKDVIIPAVMARVQTFSDIWNNVLKPEVDKFLQFIKPGIEDMKAIFDTFVTSVLPLLKQFADFFMLYIWPTIGSFIDLVGLAFAGLVVGLAFILGGLFILVTSAFRQIVTIALGIWYYFGPGITSIFTEVFQFLKGAMDLIVGIFTGNGDKVKNGFLGMFNGIANGLKGTFQLIGGAFKLALNGAIIDPLNSVIDKIPNEIAGAKISKPGYIPRFASGTRNFEGGLATINEYGKKEALNIGDTLYLPQGSDVYNAKDTKAMMGQSGPVTININGANRDPRDIANEVIRMLAQANRNAGLGMNNAYA